jgi:UDP-N-acetyl-D-glucosamine/UDP-N-acetyl-D-galactosamine dehydrogenase
MAYSDTRISVTGLGYVGLPVAVHLSRKFETIGFDINQQRVVELSQGYDRTLEVADDELQAADLLFTSEIDQLKSCNFHIIAVPTPIDQANVPDLSALLGASRTVAQVLKKGDIVVYESTVYPGATEEECIPVLEQFSGLKAGVDFKVGYSPERINPGDKEHTFTKITKVVSGQDEESLEIIAHVYGSVVEAGVFRAKSIRVAEAAKVIENTQRDVNIALMNELSMIFSKMDICSYDVLEAASTKWNFLPFTPGLVGGHCIGVDPYYLTHKAEILGYHPEVILAGRRINDNMAHYVCERIIKALIHRGHSIKGQQVNIYGLTFKENCPDLRNTKVTGIINELKEYGMNVSVTDAYASNEEAMEELGVELTDMTKLEPALVSVFAVAHEAYRSVKLDSLGSEIIFDLKNVFKDTESDGRILKL